MSVPTTGIKRIQRSPKNLHCVSFYIFFLVASQRLGKFSVLSQEATAKSFNGHLGFALTRTYKVTVCTCLSPFLTKKSIFCPFQGCAFYWGFTSWIAYYINHPRYTPPCMYKQNTKLTLVLKSFWYATLRPPKSIDGSHMRSYDSSSQRLAFTPCQKEDCCAGGTPAGPLHVRSCSVTVIRCPVL